MIKTARLSLVGAKCYTVLLIISDEYCHHVIVYLSPKIIESGITSSGFLQFDAKDFDDIGLTKLGKKLFLKIFTELKGNFKSSFYMHGVMLTVTHACSYNNIIVIMILSTHTHTDQQAVEKYHSREGSRSYAPHYSIHVKESDQQTVNGEYTVLVTFKFAVFAQHFIIAIIYLTSATFL